MLSRLDYYFKLNDNGGSGGGNTPTETINITENGTYNVINYASANVNVPSLKTMLDTTKSTQYFFYAYKGTSIDGLLNYNDTENVTRMNSMFKDAEQLITIPLLNTSNVYDMGNMFYECDNLKSIPPLDTKNVTTMSNLCYRCINLITIEKLDIGKLNIYGVANIVAYCTNLKNLTLLNIKLSIQISNGSTWGHLLTLDSLINTCKECINVGSALTLTMGTANIEKLANVYVKFVDSSQTTIATNEKGEVEVCESTDTGAMLISDYMQLKNWSIA